MEENIKDNGSTEDNMEKVYLLNLMGNKEKGNGLMEKELDGQKKKKIELKWLSFMKLIASLNT